MIESTFRDNLSQPIKNRLMLIFNKVFLSLMKIELLAFKTMITHILQPKIQTVIAQYNCWILVD